MDILSLPDIVCMLVLMGILGWARRQYGGQNVNLWLIGLGLVLVANVGALLDRGAGWLPRTIQLISYDAFVVGGITFAFAARRDRLPPWQLIQVVAAPALPLLILTSAYSLDQASVALFVKVILAALVLGPFGILKASFLSVRRRRLLCFVHCGIWLPMLWIAGHGQLEMAVYWGLTCLYLLVAGAFRKTVRNDAAGGLVIVSGFAIWALCLFLHPLLHQHTMSSALIDRIRGMQKFFIIMGMLLMQLENETRLRQNEAMHDSLTGLPNRRLFEDRLSQALERSRRSGSLAALFTLDLNGFKQINDTLGHRHGDIVLQEATRHLRTKVRGSDTLARCGGDEFCIIVSDVKEEYCALVLDIFRQAVNSSVSSQYGVTCSIGYALFPTEAQDAQTLVDLADQRMYADKRSQFQPRVEVLQGILSPVL